MSQYGLNFFAAHMGRRPLLRSKLETKIFSSCSLFSLLLFSSILDELNEVEYLWVQVLWFVWGLMNICIVLYSISVQHSTDCTPYTNNWTSVSICSCTQTPRSQTNYKLQLLPPGEQMLRRRRYLKIHLRIYLKIHIRTFTDM